MELILLRDALKLIVGIRSYQLEKTSDQRKDLTWERMLRDKKEFLAH